MSITRRNLADEIDRLDDKIAELQTDKAEIFKAYRAQLECDGVARPDIAVEVTAIKAAIRRRRSMEDDPRAVENKDALIDAIYVEISGAAQRGMVSATRTRACASGEAVAPSPSSSCLDETAEPPGLKNPDTAASPDQTASSPVAPPGAEPAAASAAGGRSQHTAVAGADLPPSGSEWRTPELIEISDDDPDLPNFLRRGHPLCVAGRNAGPPPEHRI